MLSRDYVEPPLEVHENSHQIWVMGPQFGDQGWLSGTEPRRVPFPFWAAWLEFDLVHPPIVELHRGAGLDTYEDPWVGKVCFLEPFGQESDP